MLDNSHQYSLSSCVCTILWINTVFFYPLLVFDTLCIMKPDPRILIPSFPLNKFICPSFSVFCIYLFLLHLPPGFCWRIMDVSNAKALHRNARKNFLPLLMLGSPQLSAVFECMVCYPNCCPSCLLKLVYLNRHKIVVCCCDILLSKNQNQKTSETNIENRTDYYPSCNKKL